MLLTSAIHIGFFTPPKGSGLFDILKDFQSLVWNFGGESRKSSEADGKI
jgi:hypothetical protein